jgi:glycerol-3-phosphate dehydrogenase (NAD+)
VTLVGIVVQAAIMRQGLGEMRVLAERIYPTVRDLTFFESCGVADLIATCYGGRNRLVAESYVEYYNKGIIKTFEELEVRF